MRIVTNQPVAQGDILIIPVTEFPPKLGAEVERAPDGALIVTHSETGHHHVIERERVTMHADEVDPMTSWLEVHDVEELPRLAELLHRRPHDTHESYGLNVGKYMIRRQREKAPEGWRQVND